MSTEENKQLVLRWNEKRNKGNAHVVDELCAADRVLYMSGLPFPGPVRGREPFKQLFAANLAAGGAGLLLLALPGLVARFLAARLGITALVLLWVGIGLGLTHAARTADPVVRVAAA